jgi:hypothetical protein
MGGAPPWTPPRGPPPPPSGRTVILPSPIRWRENGRPLYGGLPIFQSSHTNEFFGKIPSTRELCLSTDKVKGSRWVYDRGGQETTRKLKTVLRAIQA